MPRRYSPTLKMKRFSKFIDFNAEEFAANESFQSYIFRRDENDIAFWEDFISGHPEKISDIKEASRLLSRLKFRPYKIRRQSKQAEFDRLFTALPLTKVEKVPKKNDRLALYERITRNFARLNVCRATAAASALVIILSGGSFLVNSLLLPSGAVTFRTKYGENATYLLPDSTVVILNGNSLLKHKGGWEEGIVREVWLEGEAFFDVKHQGTSEKARFIVHTRGMDVEVLGTRFNVFNRKQKVNVVLNSGKVKLRITSPGDTSTLTMAPDEAVEFSPKDFTLIKKRVKAEAVTSWRNQILVFDNTPLSRIGEMIEYTYGLKVIFGETVDTTEQLAGTVPCQSLEVLLDVLARSSNLHIMRQNDRLIIDRFKPKSTNH